MVKLLWRVLVAISLLLASVSIAFAQTDDTQGALPASYMMNGFRYEAQWWNNCGPATITMALSYFGYTNNQERAQNFLKPNIEDKNVSPHEIVDFVNTQVSEIPVYALQRVGGDLDTLRTLVANDFPVIIEAGYDPPNLGAGWMGHYLLMIGYDDVQQRFTTYDSYGGANALYSYDSIEEDWRHFNYTYIVLYEAARETELLSLLGDDADPFQNNMNALMDAIANAETNPNDAFAWFNIGSTLVSLAEIEAENGNVDASLQYYTNAATAFDQARNTGNLPWRMLWYQFTPYQAYYVVAQNAADVNVANLRYSDMLELAGNTIANCRENDGLCYVEESYYYGGLARWGLGETDRALTNFNTAIQIRSNYQEAIDARDELLATGG